MTFLSRAVVLLGIAKRRKNVEPREEMITACSIVRIRIVINIVRVARRDWKR